MTERSLVYELTPDDRNEVLAALRLVGEAVGIDDFAARVCRELLRLVPGVRASYNELNTASQRAFAFAYPDPGPAIYAYTKVFERHMLDNPILCHFEATGESDVTTWTDVDPEGHFRSRALYLEFYAPAGIHSQIAFVLPAPPGIHVALVVNRDGTDFTSRERALLSELRLHLVNIYRLVSHADAFRQRDAALADDGWSVLLVSDDGTVLESNDLAVALGKAAGTDLSVGSCLAGGPLWTAMVEPHLDLWALSLPAGPRKLGSVGFEARLLRSAIGPHVMWIRSPRRVTVADVRAVGPGFTPRLAQVAMLLIDGLTNRQIAEKLGIHTGTAGKHVESIFKLLGVRSRAAAVGRLQGLALRNTAG